MNQLQQTQNDEPVVLVAPTTSPSVSTRSETHTMQEVYVTSVSPVIVSRSRRSVKRTALFTALFITVVYTYAMWAMVRSAWYPAWIMEENVVYGAFPLLSGGFGAGLGRKRYGFAVGVFLVMALYVGMLSGFAFYGGYEDLGTEANRIVALFALTCGASGATVAGVAQHVRKRRAGRIHTENAL